MNDTPPIWAQFLPLILLGLLTLPPAMMMLKKAGLSRWWAVLMIWPVFGYIVFAWIIGLRRWPSLDRKKYQGIFGDGGIR